MAVKESCRGPAITFPRKTGMNGQTALEAAYNAQSMPKTFTFNLQYYGTSFGYLVDMINGTFDTALSTDAPYFFWDFAVNGDESQYGTDNTPISDGDIIEFSFIYIYAGIYSEQEAGSQVCCQIFFELRNMVLS